MCVCECVCVCSRFIIQYSSKLKQTFPECSILCIDFDFGVNQVKVKVTVAKNRQGIV